MAVEGINEQTKINPYANQQYGDSGIDQAALQAQIKEIAPLLAEGGNLTVNGNSYNISIQDEKLKITMDVPELEDAEGVGVDVDLAALVAYLQMEDAEKQLEVAKQRIEMTKSRIEADHKSTQAKCQETIETAKKAEEKAAKSRLVSKITMAIMMALSVVLTAVTMGAGGLIVMGLVTGGMVAMSKTGANKAITQGIGKGFAELAKGFCDTFGIEYDEGDVEKVSKIVAGAMLVAAEIALSIVTMKKLPKVVGRFGFHAIGGGRAIWMGLSVAGQAGEKAMMIGNIAVDASMIVMATMGCASEIMTATAQYDEQMAQAELAELEAFLTELQKRLEDEEDIAKVLMELIYSYVDSAAEILASKTETETEIARYIA